MKKLLTSLVLVLVLCLACGIAMAAQDANAVGESYGTLTYTHNGVSEQVDWYDPHIQFTKPTCATYGSVEFPCRLGDGSYHTAQVAPRGHIWDYHAAFEGLSISQKKANPNPQSIEFKDVYNTVRKGTFTQDAKDPCKYVMTCDCGATKTMTFHYWSSESGDLNWGKITDKYTCVNGGIAIDYCLKCGTTTAEKTRAIDPLGHDFGVYAKVSDPHCEKGDKANEYKVVDGKAVLVCKRCGAEAAVGDKIGSYALKAEDLTRKITFSMDTGLATFEEKAAGNGKTYELKAADLTALNNKFSSQAKGIAALHDFDGWVVTTAPTCEKKGVRTHWCKRCGSNYKEEMDMIAHDFVQRQTLLNCFDARYDYVCTMCGKNLSEKYDEIVKDYQDKIDKAVADNKLEDAGKIQNLLKAFEAKYKSYKTPVIEAVKAHEYKVNNDYLVPVWDENGELNEDVYDANHPYWANCTKGAYRAYYCIHWADGDGANGTHSEATHEGIHYVKVAEPLGHIWTPWSVVYEVGAGENETGFYQRTCNRCGAWENRHSETSPVIEATNANGFVLRLFKALLNEDDVSAVRVAEWADPLADGTATAAQTVAGFVGSDAFAARDLSNKEIVNALYAAMLGRPANDGKAGEWVDLLNNGVSLDSVINGFAGSEEFLEYANGNDFVAGQLPVQSRDVNPRITAFVERCYNTTLERVGEEGGLNYWTSELLNGVQSPKQVATGFVFSAEYDAANKIADEEKVEGVVYDLYKLYLGRTPSEVEADWYVDLLEGGMKLDELNHMFADSVEFENIVKSFGLSTEW